MLTSVVYSSPRETAPDLNKLFKTGAKPRLIEENTYGSHSPESCF
jgi:hypothetical protein